MKDKKRKQHVRIGLRHTHTCVREHTHAHTRVHSHATHKHTEECWGISRIVKFLSKNSQTNTQTKQTSQNLPTSN